MFGSMEFENITTFRRPFLVNEQKGIFRLYDSKKDDLKLVTTLFTKMNSKEGLEDLRLGDKTTFIGSNENFRLVAECNNQLVATITLMKKREFVQKRIVNMYSVVTKEEFRKTGVSGEFFEFACKWASNIGGSSIQLSTKKDNIRAQKFFEKMGCKKIKVENDEFIYSKKL